MLGDVKSNAVVFFISVENISMLEVKRHHDYIVLSEVHILIQLSRCLNLLCKDVQIDPAIVRASYIWGDVSQSFKLPMADLLELLITLVCSEQ